MRANSSSGGWAGPFPFCAQAQRQELRLAPQPNRPDDAIGRNRRPGNNATGRLVAPDDLTIGASQRIDHAVVGGGKDQVIDYGDGAKID